MTNSWFPPHNSFGAAFSFSALRANVVLVPFWCLHKTLQQNNLSASPPTFEAQIWRKFDALPEGIKRARKHTDTDSTIVRCSSLHELPATNQRTILTREHGLLLNVRLQRK